MSYPSTPKPNQPKDPGVYGGRWGEPGDNKPGSPPPDRPKKIEPPAEGEGNRTPDTPPSTGAS
jgi:hypothetical protein